MSANSLKILLSAFLIITFGMLMLLSDRPLFYSTLLWALLSALLVYDIFYLRLPNWLNLLILITGLVFVFKNQIPLWEPLISFLFALISFLLISYFYTKFRNKKGIGGGDIKLFAAASVWLLPFQLPLVLLIASVSALFFILVKAIINGRSSLSERIAFGPFLATGIWIIWLFGQEVMFFIV